VYKTEKEIKQRRENVKKDRKRENRRKEMK
jgi:hypothetical protein